jgi:hypothetical protein
MYKNILLAIIIAIFAGCSAPKPQQVPSWYTKPQQVPSWYTKPPKDFKNFYAIGAAENEQKAKSIAINTLRQNISADIEASVKSLSHRLSYNLKMHQKIKDETMHLCNTFSMKNVKIQKTKLFNAQTLVLVSITKEELFKKIQPDLNSKIKNLKAKYNNNKNILSLERYIYLKPLMSQYAYLISGTAFAQIAIPTYNSNNNLKLLNEISDEYYTLKSKINFYVLSDGNSRIYSKALRDAIKKEGLRASGKNRDNNTLKLLITSKTNNEKKYMFNISKNLIKFTTYDANKNKIFFRQHTFIGKSRKNHKDAKLQTIEHINTKIKQLGVFSLIGVQSK